MLKKCSMANSKRVGNHYLLSCALHFRASIVQWQTALCLWFLISFARVHNQQQEYVLWFHLVSCCVIWQLGRNPPLPGNAVAMVFVETIQTLQLICEAWWELRTLKMQNRKDDSWRVSLTLFCLLFSHLPLHPLFLLSLAPLKFPNLSPLYKLCISINVNVSICCGIQSQL